MEHNVFSDITPDIVRLADLSRQAGIIEQELFTKYEVKRGLRDLNGKGVLAGLTTISDVRANKIVNGEQVPTHGELFYRGYNVKDLVKGFTADGRFGFEEVAYLLLFDALPDAEELSKSYGGQRIFRNVSFDVKRSDKVAIIGPNGVGKSTLFRMLLKEVPTDSGLIRFGTNVFIGYYDQEQAKLDETKAIY